MGFTMTNKKRIESHDIVIVGGGPVGLAAAVEFSNLGIKTILLETSDSFSDGSRAICWSQRTLEIMDRSGAATKMLEKGVTWNQGRVYLKHHEIYNFDLQMETDLKMPAFINLQQYYVEEFLESHLRGKKLTDIRRLNEVDDISITENKTALLSVITPNGKYEINAKYVIAADGVNSFLRKRLGLETKGQKFEEKFLITDIHVKEPYPMERRFWFDPIFHKGQSALLHVQPDNILRIDLQLGVNADPKIESNPTRVQSRIQKMLGENIDFDIQWISVYSFSCKRMDRFVHEPVFFVGDAAHVVSPFGARGGNGGIQDIDNLVWKLASVLKGLAPKSLLKSYDFERVPAADENILNSSRSTDFMTPKNEASKEFREAVFLLSKNMPFARKLVNSGRLSSPHSYHNSFLNSKDDPAFTGKGPIPGSASLDAVLGLKSAEVWLLDYLGREFCCLVFVNDSILSSKRFEEFRKFVKSLNPQMNLVMVSRAIISKNMRATVLVDKSGKCFNKWSAIPGSVYLVRPDQHIATRWKNYPELENLEQAFKKALGHCEGK